MLQAKYIHKIFRLNSKICCSITKNTKFIDYKTGPADNLFINQRDITIEDNSQEYVWMKIKSVGINRAELLHREGKYPISSQQEKNIGLQASGEIIDPNTNQKIMDGIALLPGGSYAEWAKVLKTHVLPLPQNLSYVQGAAIPEAWLTAFQLLSLAKLNQGQSVVIYAGASGVGTAATQIAKKVMNLKPYCVASSRQKGEICLQLGAEGVTYYKTNQKWSDQLLYFHQNKKFDAVLDCVCASNINDTINLLNRDGRWILYGTLSGIKGEVNFGQLLGKRISLISTTLKSRTNEYKNQLIQNFASQVIPHFKQQTIKPIIHKTLQCNWNTAQAFIKAHKLMQKNENVGKIIIQYI